MRLKITYPTTHDLAANIKINAALQAALDSVNGRASNHTATVSDIRDQAVEAEVRLADLHIAKKDRHGAQRVYTSGDSVPGAYKWSRKATRFVVERGATDWYLIDVKAVEIYNDGGGSRMILTQAQSDIAHAKLSEGFAVRQPAPVAVAA